LDVVELIAKFHGGFEGAKNAMPCRYVVLRLGNETLKEIDVTSKECSLRECPTLELKKAFKHIKTRVKRKGGTRI